MRKERKIYDAACRRQTVNLPSERKNKSELARELCIYALLLCKEFNEFAESSFPCNGHLKLTTNQERIMELEKKLASIELEHSIFKKAVAIFSKTDK